MTSELPELLNKVVCVSPFNSPIYFGAIKEPNKYNLSDLGERREVRRIGIDNIPIRGKGVYRDNEYLVPESPDYIEYIRQFPELGTTESRVALVEMVEDVNLIPGTDQVELKIKKYVIQEK